MKYQKLKELASEHKNEHILDRVEIICDELGEHDLFDHMEHVAIIASNIAENYGFDSESMHLAGYLHDIGRLVDVDEYIALLDEYNIKILEEEKSIPDVLHGKISKLVCEDIFNISDEKILFAVMSHTTLRREATDFEKIIFLADKMTWVSDDLVYIIDETVMQTLNVTCYNVLEWLINDIEKKGGKVLKQTLEAYDYFKGSMLF